MFHIVWDLVGIILCILIVIVLANSYILEYLKLLY